MEMAIFAHQTHVSTLAVLTELLRGFDGEQHRLVTALVGAVFLVIELDHPGVAVLDDEIARLRHRDPRGYFQPTTTPGDRVGFRPACYLRGKWSCQACVPCMPVDPSNPAGRLERSETIDKSHTGGRRCGLDGRIWPS